RINQTTLLWEGERARLNGEIERLARIQAATQEEAEKAFAALKAAASAKPAQSVNTEALAQEVERVEKLVKEISVLIDDPTTNLSVVIRKNVERAELESYLKGIRYAVNGTSQ